MRDQVSQYRQRGEVSLYCFYHRSQHVKYHAIHIWQLRQLARLSSVGYFGRMADRFEQDYDPQRKGPGKQRE